MTNATPTRYTVQIFAHNLIHAFKRSISFAFYITSWSNQEIFRFFAMINQILSIHGFTARCLNIEIMANFSDIIFLPWQVGWNPLQLTSFTDKGLQFLIH